MSFTDPVSSDFIKFVKIPDSKKPTLINFAATDFTSLRDSLIEYAKAVYPNEYQYFVESDLGMMFLELVAYMGSVMSMKADMLANENFLATAKQRSSVKKLLELIGVTMRGPLSAAADAQIVYDYTPLGAASPLTQIITIPPSDRVTTITSPEDGGQVTYTLYKVENGLLEKINSAATIQLTVASDNFADESGTSSIVFKNLALQEGSLVTDTGDFASTEGVKNIKLTQSPVVDGSVQVFINSTNSNVSGAYTEVDNLYFASGTTDRIYEVIYDNDYAATVLFGDSTVGISPDATASYLVAYRVGGGSRGNLAKNAINSIVQHSIAGSSVEGVITNTSLATGGQNAESVSHAKKWGPLTFRRQDRLVTLDDYTVFTNNFIGTFGTIGKAVAATRQAYSAANVVDIYVIEKASAFQAQKSTPEFKTQLLAAINKKKMATDEVVIVDGLIRTLDLVTTIRIDKEQQENQSVITAKVRDKILRYMNLDNRDFGESLLVSELNRQIFEVDEVRFSTLDNVTQNVMVDFNEIIQLNNLTINIVLLD